MALAGERTTKGFFRLAAGIDVSGVEDVDVPKVMAPRQSSETYTPVLASRRYFIRIF